MLHTLVFSARRSVGCSRALQIVDLRAPLPRAAPPAYIARAVALHVLYIVLVIVAGGKVVAHGAYIVQARGVEFFPSHRARQRSSDYLPETVILGIYFCLT